MGKLSGFLEYERCENPFREAGLRLQDYQDLHTPQPASVRQTQAARCMNCGVPFCQSDYGCPLHNLIPEWNDLLYRGHEQEALRRLLQTAPFPEFTGHVCPALCEKACNLSSGAGVEEGVTNRDNELYLIETGFAKGWIQPRLPRTRSGLRVTVAGSGPSGLAAADLLNQLGHTVTVVERADRPGGLLMYGIPNMKLPKSIVERRIRLMEAEGISFLTDTEITPEQCAGSDAALLCCGARVPRSLHVDREHAPGVSYAVDYLSEVTRDLLEEREPALTARGKRVIVVGGGDTGNDCVGSALRQGCSEVLQLEMMPAPPALRTPSNPWPEWPRTLRTDYGQLEAIYTQGSDPRIYETTVKELLTDETGALCAIKTVRVRRSDRGSFDPVPGSEQTLPCELLLIAAGFTGCEPALPQALGLSLSPRGTLQAAGSTYHLGGNLFSAGDMRTGQSLVVRALADGRAAAKAVDTWLREHA